MGHLLVIDDDPALALLLKETLTAFGHRVEVAYSAVGLEARLRRTPVDLLLIDLAMPEVDGKDAVRSVRRESDLPIIVVSSCTEVAERVAALDAGADDFVLKPCSPDELAARVRAQLRRADSAAAPSTMLRFEQIELDLGARQVRIRGELVHFTPTELDMLILLATNASRLITHRQLYRQVWPDGSAESGHYVRVYIQQIRRKLKDDVANPTFIATEMSHGYRWLPQPV